MKKIIAILMLLFCICMLSACGCRHEWKDATCETPKTCFYCEETQGEPLGHNWQDVSNACTQICANCGMAGGEQKEHQWIKASCTNPKTCSVCKITDGDKTPHVDFVQMNTNGDQIHVRCLCGQEETLTAQDLMLRLLQGKWTLKAVQTDGKYYPPEPEYNWEEGTWLEFPGSGETVGYQAGLSSQGIHFVLPYNLSGFQLGGMSTSDGSMIPVFQCTALADSSDGSTQPVALRMVMGARAQDPDSIEVSDFISRALNGSVLCLWRFTESTNYLYCYNAE